MTERIDPASTLVDAVQRFNARTELAELDTGTNELKLIRDTIKEQTPLFVEYVRGVCPELYERLRPNLSNGLESRLNTKIKQDNEEEGAADDDYGVFFTVQGGSFEPVLMIDKSAVNEAYKLLAPLYTRIEPETESRRAQLEGAAILVTWMALGKLAFDTLSDFQTSEKLISRYRLMGMFAYKGLVLNSERMAEEQQTALSDIEIGMFKIFYTKFGYSAKAENDPGKITALEFALANNFKEIEGLQVLRELTSTS
jgi:hypothetical protein